MQRQVGHPLVEVSWLECEEALRRFDLRLPEDTELLYAAAAGQPVEDWRVFSAMDMPTLDERITDYSTHPFGLRGMLRSPWEWAAFDPFSPWVREFRGEPVMCGCSQHVAIDVPPTNRPQWVGIRPAMAITRD